MLAASILLAMTLAEPRLIKLACTDPIPGVTRVIVGPGTQKVVSVPGFRGLVREGESKDGVDLKFIGNDQLLIIGVRRGEFEFTTFGSAGRQQFRVSVNPQGCDLSICELCRLFQCGTGVSLEQVGDRLFLTGTARSLEDWTSVRKAAGYSNVVSTVKLPAHHVDRAVHDANRALWKAGFERARIVVVGEKALLEGEVPQGPEQDKVRALAAPWVTWIEALLSPKAPEPVWVPDADPDRR